MKHNIHQSFPHSVSSPVAGSAIAPGYTPALPELWMDQLMDWTY